MPESGARSFSALSKPNVVSWASVTEKVEALYQQHRPAVPPADDEPAIRKLRAEHQRRMLGNSAARQPNISLQPPSPCRCVAGFRPRPPRSQNGTGGKNLAVPMITAAGRHRQLGQIDIGPRDGRQIDVGEPIGDSVQKRLQQAVRTVRDDAVPPAIGAVWVTPPAALI